MIFSPSLSQACSEKNKELLLLQVGVETESLLLVQMMCCEDSVHVTRTLFYPIHTEIFAPKINEINFIPGRTVFVTSEKYRPTNHRPRTALCH